MAYPDLGLHHRQHTHAGFSACPHGPGQLLPLQPEPSCGQSDKRGEEVLQASSIALQLAALHCHLAPPVQYAVAESGFDGQVGHLAAGPVHVQCSVTGDVALQHSLQQYEQHKCQLLLGSLEHCKLTWYN